jgi:phosphoesterase RecJ-like protein
VILLFKECSQGQVKISWRSKCHIDVNQIARRFGGGGHRFSCGARLNLPLRQTVKQVITQTKEAMQENLVAA